MTDTSTQPAETDPTVESFTRTSAIETDLVDDLSSFLGEIKAIFDLLTSAANNERYTMDNETLSSVTFSLYCRAGDIKKRLDGGVS